LGVQTTYLDARVLAAANINPVTGLATDYLNHYNEVAMLIGSLADMPEMTDTILEWRPVDYPEHFHITGFRDKDLAIAAWEAVQPVIRERFEAARREIDVAVAIVQVKLASKPDSAPALVKRAAGIFERIAKLGSVINGAEPARATQTAAPVAAMSPGTSSQAEIDSLFD
jgi:hypothetical protein